VMLSAGWDRFELRVSDSIVGDWSDPVTITKGIVQGAAQSPFGVYAGTEHVELAQNDGQTLIATYYTPKGAFHGNLRALSIQLETP
jgi:hypothetical protein